MMDSDDSLMEVAAGELPGGPLRIALTWWNGLAGGDVPPLAMLDPVALPDGLMAHVVISRGPTADGSYLSMFVGSAVTMFTGRHKVGESLETVYGGATEFYQRALRFHRLAARLRGPVLSRVLIGPDTERTVESLRLGLPFGNGDGDGGMGGLLTAILYRPSPAAMRDGVRVLQDSTRLFQSGFYRVVP